MKTMLLTIPFLAAVLGASTSSARADNKAAARERFERGVAAFADKRFGEAADEFEAAYRLEPAFQVLYNIGQVDVALGRSVEAITAYQQYLALGGAAVAPDRRREVESEIEKQLERVGMLSVRTRPDGAEVRIDGRLIGKTPTPNPIRVNAGHHVVEAVLGTQAHQVRDVEVAGRADITVEFALETPAKPAVASLPAVPAPPPAREPATTVATAAATPATALATAWQRNTGIVLAVAGLAAATTGGLLVYSGAHRANNARDRLVMFMGNEMQWNTISADYNAGKDRYQLGWIVAGAGAAALAGGILLVATAPGPRAGGDVALGPWVPPASAAAAGFLVSGSF